MNFIDRLPLLRRGRRVYGLSRETPYVRHRVVMPFTDSFDETLKFINETHNDRKYHLYMDRIQGLFVDRVMRQRFQGINIFKRHELEKIWSKASEEVPTLDLFYRNITQYNGRNFFYDIGVFNELFYQESITRWDIIMEYFDQVVMERLRNLPDDYTEKFIVIPLSADDIYSPGDITQAQRPTDDILYNFLVLLKFEYDLEKFVNIFGGTEIIFGSSAGLFRLNFEVLQQQEETGDVNFSSLFNEVIRLMRRIAPSEEAQEEEEEVDEKEAQELDIETDEEIEDEDIDQDVKELELVDKLSQEGDDEEIKRAVEKAAQVASSEEDIEEIVNIMLKVNDLKLNRVSEIDEKEQKYLREVMNVTVDGENFEEIADNIEDLELEEESYDITSIDEYDENKFVNFNKTYDKKLKKYDIAQIGQAFSEMDVPLYVQDIKIEDDSDDLNYKEKVVMKFKDMDGDTHKVNVDLPKMMDDRFLYLGGSKKSLISQIMLHPVSKVGDRVIITSNYNKLFLNYKGGKYLTPIQSKFKRGVEKHKEKLADEQAEGVSFGSHYDENFETGETTQEYNEVSRYISEIEKDDLYLTFDLTNAKERYPEFMEEHKIDEDHYSKIALGEKGDEIISYNVDTEEVEYGEYEGMSLSEFMIELSQDKFPELFEDIDSVNTVPKTIRHSSLYILGRDVPLILILAYLKGLDYVLDKIDLDYELIPKDEEGSKPRLDDKFKQGRIEFSDVYMVYELDELPAVNLMSYLQKMDLTDYSFADMEDKDKLARILMNETDSHNFPMYIDNYDNLMIDPITEEVLHHFSLPTDFSDLLIYANFLLSTGENKKDIDIRNARIRNQEIITATLFNVLAEQYEEFSAKKKRGAGEEKFSVPDKAVINKLHELPNVQEYSTINPIREYDKMASASFKGLRGINEERAYTAEKRMFDPSFYGKFSMVSSYGAGIGVTKALAIDPKIQSARGFMENVEIDDVNEMDSKHLLSPSEAVTPMITSSDDPPRTAMAKGQMNHVVPTDEGDPILVSNGFDEAIAEITSEFAFKAEKDGKVTEVEGNYVTIEYDDGTSDVFPLKRAERNAAKGMFMTNDLTLMPNVNVGSKVSEGQVVAYNDKFFKTDGKNLHLTPGPIITVALHSAPETYEDSTMVSENVTDKLATRTVQKYAVKLEKNGKVHSAVTEFKDVRSGDVLMEFESMLGDEELDAFLNVESTELNKYEKKTKRTGKIIDMKTYRTCNLDDLSESLKYYIKKIDDYMLKSSESGAKAVEEKGSQKQKILNSKKNKKVDAGESINGVKVEDDEVLFEWYVESYDTFSKGDKCVGHTALKFINARVVPDDEMPVGQETGRKVDMVMSPYSPAKRKVMSNFKVGWMNTALLKLIDDLKEDLGLDD